jgi:hypothetical protein
MTSAMRVIALCAVLFVVGCSTQGETRSASKVNAPLLGPGMLEEHGLAFLTPTTGPDFHQDKHALALVFAATLGEMRPAVRIVPLAQTLGAVNRAGLIQNYQRMYQGFEATGALERDALGKLRGVTGARYFVLLQLGDFNQSGAASTSTARQSRSSPMAQIRLFAQIWDSIDGTIAWEGIDEVSSAANAGSGSGANFTSLVERAARDLAVRLP